MKTKITYVGHATTLIETKGKRILTDPVLRNRLWFLFRFRSGIKEGIYRNLDAVVISHAHKDHFDVSSLKMIDKSTKIIAPVGVVKLLKKRGLGNRDIEGVRVGDSVKIGSVTVKAVPANHSNSFKPLITRAEFLGYIVKGKHSVYFPGDTNIFNGMKRFGKLDVAMLPVWGWGPTLGPGHMNPWRASEALKILKPRIAIPIHWGTFHPLGIGYLGLDYMKMPPVEFRNFALKSSPDIDVRILNPGEKTEVT